MDSISVSIVSPHRIFRECLAQCLEGASAFTCFFASSTQEPILEASSPPPDLVLVDHSGCSDETILQFIRDVRNESPTCRLLVIGNEESEQQLTRYIEAGAAGFVAHVRSARELMAAIESVLRYDADCAPEQASLIFARLQQLSLQHNRSPALKPCDLTIRELEILKLIDLGRSNKEIAGELHLSIHTVKTHVHNILEKLGAANRRRAVFLAYNKGWLTNDK